jgi:hypothetical protein
LPDLLPNSIPRNPKIDWSISRGDSHWLYIFCANCGADGGRVLEAHIPNREEFAFYLCNSCAEKHGNIPGTVMVPDEVFFAKATEMQLEKYGRTLTAEEVAIELEDGSSFMSKLAKEKP